MKYTQSCVNSPPPSSFYWAIDFDALRLQCSGSDGIELDQSFATLAELEAVYRARIVPLFRDDEGGCIDVDRGAEVTSVPDLAAFAAELRACGYDWAEPPRAAGDPVEELVAGLTTSVRRELDRALGPAATTLAQVVLLVGTGRIQPAIKDPPAILGKTDEEIARVIAADKRRRWLKGERLAFSLSHEYLGWGELPSFWADPWQYGPDGVLGAALDLVAVRIEANPRLRDNVSIPGELRIFTAFEDSEAVLLERRALARQYLDRPSRPYFEQCGRHASGS